MSISNSRIRRLAEDSIDRHMQENVRVSSVISRAKFVLFLKHLYMTAEKNQQIATHTFPQCIETGP